MKQTIFAILTNEEARDAEQIEANLDLALMRYMPWFGVVATPTDVPAEPIQ